MTSGIIREQVLEANRRFYAAVEALDLEALEAVWETSARAACVHPGGGWVLGWEEVRRSWEAIIEATSRIEFEVEEVVVRLEDPVAWVTCVERVTGPDGQTAEIAATNGFVLGSRGWRMVLHHASPIVRPDAFGG